MDRPDVSDRYGNTTQQKLPMSGVPYGHLPAFLPGSASLVEQLDRRIMVVLRDGRHLVGILRSFDQFSNMVFEDTSERRILHAKKGNTTICYYTDIELGLYLIRGDSMVLLGEVGDTTLGQVSDEDSAAVNENASDLEDNDIKKYMKKLTLEQFEEMEEKLQSDELVDELVWEFDTDLVV